MSKTILLIEDDTEVLRVYKTVLSQFGPVRTAQDMAQARGQFEGVDLVILDYHLRNEKASFQDVVSELKPVAPILLCSGIPDPAIRAQGARFALAGYWNKGTGLEALVAKVKSILGA